MTAEPRILYLEPFEGGSHAAFTAALRNGFGDRLTALTLPARHWKWRMRGAALWFAEHHAVDLAGPHDVMLASSFLGIADLVALVPRLAVLPTAVYFHENQWAYPSRDGAAAERDHHFGFTQLVSAAAADACWFNSEFNRDSFVDGCDRMLAAMPDHVPIGLIARIRARSAVVPFPMHLPAATARDRRDDALGATRALGPIILWNHRWEHDKAPESFFAALDRLAQRGVPFRVAVCGEQFRQVPTCFELARERLAGRIVLWGHVDDRDEYWRLLRSAHLAVSTARHEFFGVAALEAAHAGALPLVPDRLAYPEHFPIAYRYRSESELVDRLEVACRAWTSGALDLRGSACELARNYDRDRVLPDLGARLAALAAAARS